MPFEGAVSNAAEWFEYIACKLARAHLRDLMLRSSEAKDKLKHPEESVADRVVALNVTTAYGSRKGFWIPLFEAAAGRLPKTFGSSPQDDANWDAVLNKEGHTLITIGYRALRTVLAEANIPEHAGNLPDPIPQLLDGVD